MKTKHLEIDQTDQQILIQLKQDCRRSYRELAAAIGMSPAALIERMKKLEINGVITDYSANFDYLKLGFEFMAIVQINVSGDLLEVQQKISKLKGIAAIYDVTGQYDSVAVTMSKNRNEFSALVKKIQTIPGVEKTNSSVVLNIVKKLSEFKEI